jgi:dynein heavy chain, axonemal
LSNWRTIELSVTENLNEAKDNVKYLQTLERYIEPLYEGTPIEIKETLPVLMNSIKMIHTVARYYNTDDRMTGLFVKITNQMILNCKRYILSFKNIKVQQSKKGSQKDDDSILWEHD